MNFENNEKYKSIAEKEKRVKELRKQMEVATDVNEKKRMMKEIFDILSTLKNDNVKAG